MLDTLSCDDYESCRQRDTFAVCLSLQPISYLLNSSWSSEPNPNRISRNTKHRRQRQEPSEHMSPNRVVIIVSVDTKWLILDESEEQDTETDGWSGEDPAELPPTTRIIPNHALHVLIPTIDSKTPGDSDTLEEEKPEESPSRRGVEVEELEDIESSLSYCSQTDQIGDDTDHTNEYLTSIFLPTDLWELVDDGGEEPFHSTELRVDAKE
ncbi:hypothetical protein GCK72_016706 [Caenorhabditis remanei]|uniref:Uncharacterized protein n=1 Tax=Caenorhabditis remanei TaxID=31234 RepID=A0A6A5G6P6_CAERE|nr:hypothetical protein GCK72_016706 [Caenorhabditis remanei]KAF1750159.1 hypothetical protein GCK72_016706 [Caenorhabditis remanei]